MPDAAWWAMVARDRPGGDSMTECTYGCTETLFDARCGKHRAKLLLALGKALQDNALAVTLGDPCPHCDQPVDGIETAFETGTITYRHNRGGKGPYSCVAKGLKL
jgi:hypothetical protein